VKSAVNKNPSLASLLKISRPSTDGRVAEYKHLQKLVSRKGLDEDSRLAKNFVSLSLSGQHFFLCVLCALRG